MSSELDFIKHWNKAIDDRASSMRVAAKSARKPTMVNQGVISLRRGHPRWRSCEGYYLLNYIGVKLRSLYIVFSEFQ